jgi:hypothetical protein
MFRGGPLGVAPRVLSGGRLYRGGGSEISVSVRKPNLCTCVPDSRRSRSPLRVRKLSLLSRAFSFWSPRFDLDLASIPVLNVSAHSLSSALARWRARCSLSPLSPIPTQTRYRQVERVVSSKHPHFHSGLLARLALQGESARCRPPSFQRQRAFNRQVSLLPPRP